MDIARYSWYFGYVILFIYGTCSFYMDELRSHYNRPISRLKAIESCTLPTQYIYESPPP